MNRDHGALVAQLVIPALEAAVDTRVMLGALVGWRLLHAVGVLGRTRRMDPADQHAAKQAAQPDGQQQHNAALAGLPPAQADAWAEEVAQLQATVASLRADNESLATEVVLLRSELAEASSPLVSISGGGSTLSTPPRSRPGSMRTTPNSSTNRLRRTPTRPPPKLLVLQDGTFRLREPAPPPSAPAALVQLNLRLAAENEEVRSRLEEIAPGSARGAGSSRPLAMEVASAAEDNAQLRDENRQLREALENLVSENQDLAERILEVAFMTEPDEVAAGDDGTSLTADSGPSPIGALRRVNFEGDVALGFGNMRQTPPARREAPASEGDEGGHSASVLGREAREEQSATRAGGELTSAQRTRLAGV